MNETFGSKESISIIARALKQREAIKKTKAYRDSLKQRYIERNLPFWESLGKTDYISAKDKQRDNIEE